MQEKNLKAQVVASLREVADPEVNVKVVDLGLIRHLDVDQEGQVRLTFRPTSPVCPLAFKIAQDIHEALSGIEGVHRVEMEVEDYVMAEELKAFLGGSKG